jgi:proline iminopeptidase
MKHLTHPATILTFLLVICGASLTEASEPQEDGLFPVTQPIKMGDLQVSALHRIHYELHGNPNGKPVFVLHGGPGFGCYPRLAQYFNPDKFLIVLHDQRGAGRSTPAGEIRENTTQHLVEDIERLRKHLKIDGKILIFGGSWGSTLALAYAETYPERVSGMVIRGIWTGTQAELDHYYGEQGIRKFFPDAWARLKAELPPRVREFKPKSLLELFSKGDAAIVRKVGDAWIRYAVKTGSLYAPDKKVEQGWGDYDARPGAIIDTYYASNGFFLEERQLLREASKLKDIPVTIINGRYDMICPPITAWRLHKELPQSRLIIVEEAGHSEGEPGTTKALLEAVAEFE